MESQHKLIRPATERLRDWQRKGHAWYLTHYVLGVAALVAVLTVSAQLPFVSVNELKVIAWLAAILQATNTFLASMQKATAYRNPWRHLTVAVTKFQCSDDPDESEVEEAIALGWRIIDQGYVGEKSPKTKKE